MIRVACRRATNEQWTLVNPILGSGEFAYETNARRLKIGDGLTRYVDLPYFNEGSHVYHDSSFDGDGTALNPLKLKDIGVAPGIYGSSTSIPILTINSFGQVVAAGLAVATSGSGSVTSVGIVSAKDLTITNSPITSSGNISIDLKNTGVNPGIVGSDHKIPIITIDSKGRITNASTSTTDVLASVAHDLTLAGDGTSASPLRVIGGVGSQGYQGYQGRQGHQGEQGYQGYQGRQGHQGEQGHQGYQGKQGHQGEQGYQGYQGRQGHQGEQGHQGYQGEIGSGLAVKGFATWEDIFNNKTGTSLTGDLWIVTDVSQGTATQPCPNPLAGTAAIGDGLVFNDVPPVFWANGGKLQGPIGEQGYQGYQGEQGYQGYQGEQGYQGYQGEQGAGYQGDQGHQGVGSQGDQGYQGYQGDGFETLSFTDQTEPFTVFSIDKNAGTAAFVEYFIYETLNSYYRAGTMVAVWDKTAETITMNELTTQDLNGSTSTFVFSADIIAPNVILTATFATGNWIVKLSARII